LLKRLDDFRFKHRFDSRAAAIKWLLDAALKAKLAPKEGGVTRATPIDMVERARELRALGLTWKVVGARLGVGASTVKKRVKQ
jgi:transposase